jgi:carotenoid cleavage dioxygenase-like enzyme
MQVGVKELEVQGTIPKWLEGDYYRAGPGLNDGYTHWFDGMGMLVNFRFVEGGKVFWQQRFLDTADYRMYRAAGNKPQLQAFKWSPGMFKAATDAIKDLLGFGTGSITPLLCCCYLCSFVAYERQSLWLP